MYAFRWATTLFAQDFVLPDVIVIWDRMLAADDLHSKSEFVVCVMAAMVLLKADELILADFATAVKTLQHAGEDLDVSKVLQQSERLLQFSGLHANFHR
jgi:hypothetical protein